MYLEHIQSPSDLRKLSSAELKDLAGEIRDLMIYQVSKNGGHLASNLGVVELTIAVHSVFTTPQDKIVWDVGHQSYPHKLLTGRYSQFTSLRQYRGISGFPKMDESEHDAFGTGHSSTSISAALGILEGRDRNRGTFKVLAVIGDGAMSAGLALEGLNNAGDLKKDLIVILNDNEMSISPNVGALSAHLNRILTGELFQKFKRDTKSLLENIPKVGGRAAKLAQKTEGLLKGLVLPGVIFEELGFTYVGPIDGHNVDLMIETFRRVKSSSTPMLVHVVTKKGKGYEFSEKHPSLFHGIGPFQLKTGSPVNGEKPTYSHGFGQMLTEFAEKDKKIIAISAAMREGTGLEQFAQKYPDRFYDVGIAEQHAVTFAAGLATQGLKPVVAVYSTFLQRAYDEIVHDVCLQDLHVVFAVDRAGIVGEDGPTHNGLFDISYLRHIPNMVVMSPKDGAEMRLMFRLALEHDGPVAIRYPRGNLSLPGKNDNLSASFGIGEAEVLKEGTDVAIIGIGNTVYPALCAARKLEREGVSTMVVNARFVKPLDHTLFTSIASEIPRIVTVEENVLQGGFGSAILELFNKFELSGIRVKRIGIPDVYVEQGSQKELRQLYGLDEEGICSAVKAILKEPTYTF
jgi:1-deoxy-D-xylulose-5-phosphate synthase